MSGKKRVRPIVIVNFENYNPPLRMRSKAQRVGARMTWVRLECSWIDDADLLDSDTAMILWPRLIAAAGLQRSPGIIKMTEQQLARRLHLPEPTVREGLNHLWKTGLIRYSLDGARVASTTQQPRDAWSNRGNETYVTNETDVATKTTTTKDDEPYTESPEAARLRGEASYKTAMLRRRGVA